MIDPANIDSNDYFYSQKCPQCGFEKAAIQDMTSIGKMDVKYYCDYMGEHAHNVVVIVTEYICGNPTCQHVFQIAAHPRCRAMKCTYGTWTW